MTDIQLVPARHQALPDIETALGMRLAPDADRLATYTAFLLRRLVGVLGPCNRRDVISRAKQAVAGYIDIDLDAFVRGTLEDLIVGGDVLELPVLVSEHEGESALRLLGAPPSFVVRDQRVRMIGIAPDDARFLPEDLYARMQARGGDRFIDDADMTELTRLLTELGLRRIDVARWLGKDSDETADVFLKRMTDRLTRLGRIGGLAEPSWLQPAQERSLSYHSRWQPIPPDAGRGIVRAPQRYGNPRWYFAEVCGHDLRLLDLPIDGEAATRGCDLAWTIQLALDHTRGHPARYHVHVQDAQWTRIRVEFPLPLGFRRRLLHLGGHRSIEDQGFRFYVPTADFESAEAILSGAWMVPADNWKSP